MSYKINYTKKFTRKYRKLPRDIAKKFYLLVDEVQVDPFNPKFKTHKLNGDLEDTFSLWITPSYRALFHLEAKELTFVDIGDHDIYKNS